MQCKNKSKNENKLQNFWEEVIEKIFKTNITDFLNENEIVRSNFYRVFDDTNNKNHLKQIDYSYDLFQKIFINNNKNYKTIGAVQIEIISYQLQSVVEEVMKEYNSKRYSSVQNELNKKNNSFHLK